MNEHMHPCRYENIHKFKGNLGMVGHTLNSSILEIESGGTATLLRPLWDTVYSIVALSGQKSVTPSLKNLMARGVA